MNLWLIMPHRAIGDTFQFPSSRHITHEGLSENASAGRCEKHRPAEVPGVHVCPLRRPCADRPICARQDAWRRSCAARCRRASSPTSLLPPCAPISQPTSQASSSLSSPWFFLSLSFYFLPSVSLPVTNRQYSRLSECRLVVNRWLTPRCRIARRISRERLPYRTTEPSHCGLGGSAGAACGAAGASSSGADGTWISSRGGGTGSAGVRLVCTAALSSAFSVSALRQSDSERQL